MNFNIKASAIIAVSVLFLAGCSDKPTKPQPMVEVKPTVQTIPSWVRMPIIDDGIAATDCVVDSGNFSIDRKQAVANARVDLAQQIDTNIKAMDKTFARRAETNQGISIGSTFESVSKQLTQRSLTGARPIKVENVVFNEKNHLCVMVALSPTFTEELFKNIIKTSGANIGPNDESVLREEFKAYKAQQEMDAAFQAR